MDGEDVLVGIGIVLGLIALFVAGPAVIGYLIWIALVPVGFWQSLATVIFILLVLGGYLTTVLFFLAALA